jgi:hypothetical protein
LALTPGGGPSREAGQKLMIAVATAGLTWAAALTWNAVRYQPSPQTLSEMQQAIQQLLKRQEYMERLLLEALPPERKRGAELPFQVFKGPVFDWAK